MDEFENLLHQGQALVDQNVTHDVVGGMSKRVQWLAAGNDVFTRTGDRATGEQLARYRALVDKLAPSRGEAASQRNALADMVSGGARTIERAGAAVEDYVESRATKWGWAAIIIVAVLALSD